MPTTSKHKDQNNNFSVRYTFVLLVVCLLTRLLFFVAVKPWEPSVADQNILQHDPLEYHQLAITLVNHHQFAFDKEDPPNDFRTPIYPLFISFVYSIFGEKPWMVILFQILIDAISCIALFFIIKRYLDIKIALYAALFYAIDPFLVLYANTLYSDTLFVFWCIMSFNSLSVAVSKELHKGTIRNLVLSGLFFGITILVRPVALYLTLVIAAVLFLLLRKVIGNAWKFSAVFLSVCILSISPWMIRNYITFHAFSLSTLGPLNLLPTYVTPIEMERRGQSYELVTKSLFSEADRLAVDDGYDPEELNPFEKTKYWKKLTIQYVTRYPIPVIKHSIVGVFHTFTNLSTREFAEMLHLRSQGGEVLDIKAYPNPLELLTEWLRLKSPAEKQLAVYIGTYLLISYAFLIVGLFTSWKNLNRAFLYSCVTIAAYFILVTGPAGLARLKLPLIPFYLPIVGIGLARISAVIRNKLWKPKLIEHRL